MFGYSNTPTQIFHKLFYMIIPKKVHICQPYYLLLSMDYIKKNNVQGHENLLTNASDSRTELQNFLTEKIGFEHERSFYALQKVKFP